VREGQAGALLTSVTTIDTGLTPQTSYTYQVEAVDAASNVSQRSQPLPLTTAVLGDLDGDARVTLADLRQLVQMLLGQRAVELLHADLDEDGQLSLGDVRDLVGVLAGS
jgi:predicted component of type VI protein secretion system